MTKATLVFLTLWAMAPLSSLAAAEAATKPPAGDVVDAFEGLYRRVRPAVVVVTVTGRDGAKQGVGTGFLIDQSGLVATNLHVIGEARPITVAFPDGRQRDVLAVHATDKTLDLAVVRVDPAGLDTVKPLELGNADDLAEGQEVLAVGNPHGLAHSVVRGVVSGKRVINDRPMIQLAIPIEPGNSGGPLLDRHGKVHGLLTMKSAVTANLGFAVSSDGLKPLLAKPNPVPMGRWLTIGTLDPARWQPKLGARWRERAGQVVVDGLGAGFGGRSFCLFKGETPKLPLDLRVEVKLDDEAGAAGLVFATGDGDRHYGFYPTGGSLRLTRFDGPDVFSWAILKDATSPQYMPGTWNNLRVHLDGRVVRCFVNDQLVFTHEVADETELSGGVGLTKFRQTQASFRRFSVSRAGDVAPAAEAPALTETLAKLERLFPDGDPTPEQVEAMADDAAFSGASLHRQAHRLDREARRVRELAQLLHERRTVNELAAALRDPKGRLEHAALLIAKLDNDEVDVQASLAKVDRLAAELKKSLPEKSNDDDKLVALDKLLFEQLGYHGSRGDYDHKANSYLNEVLDDREGLPITLSVLYMALSDRVGVSLEGVGLPGRYVVRYRPANGEPRYIDVYEKGERLDEGQMDARLRETTGDGATEEQKKAMTSSATIARMLQNLLNAARRQGDVPAMVRYVDALASVSDEPGVARWMRAVLAFQMGRRDKARRDVDWLLEHEPAEVDLDRVRAMARQLDQAE